MRFQVRLTGLSRRLVEEGLAGRDASSTMHGQASFPVRRTTARLVVRLTWTGRARETMAAPAAEARTTKNAPG